MKQHNVSLYLCVLEVCDGGFKVGFSLVLISITVIIFIYLFFCEELANVCTDYL